MCCNNMLKTTKRSEERQFRVKNRFCTFNEGLITLRLTVGYLKSRRRKIIRAQLSQQRILGQNKNN